MDTPLNFFVHVPKTAGSTVNGYLSQLSPNGREHCEGILQNDDKFRRECNRRDWVSGHANYCEVMLRLAAVTDRPIRMFTCVREPTKQLMSHYNWLIEIFRRGETFYNSHPRVIKVISKRIREADNSNPNAIIANLLSAPFLFLNLQSRYVLGNRFPWNQGKIFQRLDDYEFIGHEGTLAALIEKITGSTPVMEKNFNESRYHFDTQVFEEPELKKFVKYNNSLDLILYDLIRENY